MLQAFFNIWRIRDLRNKLLFTIGMLVIYRIGFFIPLPGVDQRITQPIDDLWPGHHALHLRRDYFSVAGDGFGTA